MANSTHSDHSIKPYFLIFGMLLFLSALTVFVSYIDFGAFHLAIALVIATIKAVLVILYFMHVITSEKLTKLCVLCGFLWLALLLIITYSDYLTRPWQYASVSKSSWVHANVPLDYPSAGDGPKVSKKMAHAKH